MTPRQDYPIIILSFDRTDYLRSTLISLLNQADVNPSTRRIYLFQDGAVNEFSGKQHCDPAAVAANVELFRLLFPYGTAMPAPANLGVARNFDRAERFAFEELAADAAIFLEDDLILGRYYIKTLEQLIVLALRDDRIGYVAAYGDHRASREEQLNELSSLTVMGHNWAFGLTRRQWLRQKPYIDQYMEIVAKSDYRDRDHARITALFQSWGMDVPGTSQDAAKGHASVLTHTAKINTFACFGHYIGQKGLHFTPEIFRNLGFGDTAVMDEDLFQLVPPTHEQIEHFIAVLHQSSMSMSNAVFSDSKSQTLAHLPDYYGHRDTELRRMPIWSDGSPVPWLTYPAICYLNQLNLSDKQVFEYGCGTSTSYWARRCRHVLSVENDPTWFARVSAQKPYNVEIFLQSGADYVTQISYKAPHDVIVIDGRWRADCTMNCIQYLAPAGMIILDNSERHPPLTEFFRNAGFIQVDMIGYGPQNRYIWCTSLFLSRDFNFAPAKDIQPAHGPGMIDSIEVKPDFASGNRPAFQIPRATGPV